MRSLVVALAAFCASITAVAQDYPSNTVRIVISFPAGGSTDLLARALADDLQKRLKQSVIVENRPGGNGVIAADAVARAAPDGYTLFMAVDSVLSLNPLLYPKLSYNPDKDFAPISLVATQPFFIVAGPHSPVRSFDEMIAYARANPGKLTYGSSAILQTLIGEKLKLEKKIDMLNVPFKGSPPMLQALLSGDIDLAITAVVPYATYVPQGKLFPIVTSGHRREALLPSTPVVGEVGLRGWEFGNWSALYAPAKTPQPIIDRLNAEVRNATRDKALNDRLQTSGIYPEASSPEELRNLLRIDMDRWAEVIKASGFKVQ
jgi:tripartite-type tricarboxylate transporter receptor subunit TctC